MNNNEGVSDGYINPNALMAVRVEYEPIFSAARNSYYDADNFRGN
jgi:hypothetical protein